MRIVIVEDEAPIRIGLGKILKKIDENYELAGTAENGEQGLALVLKTRPDLVILDIHMPDMDGLTMLARIRGEGLNCKALVLTAYSDFMYAKMAIELGIENYLLKPLKVAELKRTLKQIEEELMEVQSKEHFFTLDSIFYRSVTGQFLSDEQTDSLLRNQYHIMADEELAIFIVYFIKSYDLYHDTIRELLEDVNIHENTFRSSLVEVPEKKTVVMVLYKMKEKERLQDYFEKSVVPMLSGQTKGKIICSFNECKGIKNIYAALKAAREDRVWYLAAGNGRMLSKKEISSIQAIPVKYPMEMESQAKKAVMDNNKKEFMACTQRFRDYCRSVPHDPKEIKEVCIRYMMALVHTAKEYSRLSEELSMHDIMNSITQAASWEEIDCAFFQFFDRLGFREENENISLLVQRTRQMIQEYYNQGITLEEIAQKLCVSEEYLSMQFKKETGKTFSETIRGCRIDKVKELLLKSSLKLNQIADMAGYADPKYMSKVFKDEVGVTPAEYRKLNH